MKKILASILLAAASMSAFAIDYGIGATYEYDSYASNPTRLQSVQKSGIVAGFRGEYGQVDTVLYNNFVNGSGYHDNVGGLEFGYSLAHQVYGPWSLNGRFAVGRLFNRGLGSPDSTANYETLYLGAGYKLNDQVSLGAGVRHRFSPVLDTQNQYSAGVTYALDKHWSVRTNYDRTVQTGRSANGLSALVLYAF